MAASPTSSLKIEKIDVGGASGTWGTKLNTNFDLLDDAIAGYQEVVVTGASMTLTLTNYADSSVRASVLKFFGANAAHTVFVPAVSRQYIIWNGSSTNSPTLTLKATGGTTGVDIASGKRVAVFCDGTDVYVSNTDSTAMGVGGAGTLTAFANDVSAAGFKLTNLGTATNDADAVSKLQMESYVSAQIVAADGSGLDLGTIVDESGAAPTISGAEYAVYLSYAGAKTVTLPTASSSAGLVLFLQNRTAFAASSATSNVVPAGETSAGTALLPAVDGAWVVLISDGTSWRVLLSGEPRGLKLGAPQTTSGTSYTVLADTPVVFLSSASTKTVTLPTLTSPQAGLTVFLQNTGAGATISASSNVVPQGGGSAGTAILPAVDGAWAMLQWDGTSTWYVLMSGGAGAFDIAANSLTVDKLEQIAQYEMLGRNSASTGNIEKVTQAQLVASLAAASSGTINQGKHTIYFAGAGAIARTTNGPATATVETTTNKVMLVGYDFDAASVEYIQVDFQLPKSYNGGTITAQPIWRHGATTTNFKVSWGFQFRAFADGDAADQAFGTAQYSNDDGGTTNDIYIGPETSAITIAGSPAGLQWCKCQILRKADDGTNDTLAIDATLLGFSYYYTINASTDA